MSKLACPRCGNLDQLEVREDVTRIRAAVVVGDTLCVHDDYDETDADGERLHCRRCDLTYPLPDGQPLEWAVSNLLLREVSADVPRP